MKSGFLVVVVALSMVSVFSIQADKNARPEKKVKPSMEFVPGELIVAVTGTDQEETEEALEEALGGIRFTSARPTRMNTEFYKVTLSQENQIDSAIRAINAFRSRGLRYAQKNYIYRIPELQHEQGERPEALPEVSIVNADPGAPMLWGVVPSRINEAQATATGNGVLVAVIDTGADLAHQDMAGQYFVNPGEIADNGIDDDGNGLIDDVTGWNFAVDEDGPDVSDWHGHGTHVSGTIAAIKDNGVGVYGVAPNVKILPIKFIGATGYGTSEGVINSVSYALQMGAQVSNNSYGCSFCFSQAEKDVIESGIASGHVFVAAAGNSGVDVNSYPHYPSGYDLENVISVAAQQEDGLGLTSWSNYGDSVHIAAPGSSIMSTTPGDQYARYSGTSMASPHVAGIVALLKEASPSLTTAEIQERVVQSSEFHSGMVGGTETSGYIDAVRVLAGEAGNGPENTPAPEDWAYFGTVHETPHPLPGDFNDYFVIDVSGFGSYIKIEYEYLDIGYWDDFIVLDGDGNMLSWDYGFTLFGKTSGVYAHSKIQILIRGANYYGAPQSGAYGMKISGVYIY